MSHRICLGEVRGGGLTSLPHSAPNIALEPTAYSVRSCLASASGGGSPRAFGFWQSPCSLSHSMHVDGVLRR
jgi:hypothetical protein